MHTLLRHLILAHGASQMDCTIRLLFPSFGLRNKICADGRFTDGQVDQQRWLGGWSVTSGVVHLDVKKIIEQYSNNAGLITLVRY